MQPKRRPKTYKVALYMIFTTMLSIPLTGTPAPGSEQSAIAAANSLPPIDLAAPPEFDTASFGLG